MLIDWCCKKTQGEQASNWPKSRQEWRGGEGWQREAEGWDWAEMGGLAGNSVLEGAMGARGGGRRQEQELGWSFFYCRLTATGRVERT